MEKTKVVRVNVTVGYPYKVMHPIYGPARQIVAWSFDSTSYKCPKYENLLYPWVVQPRRIILDIKVPADAKYLFMSDIGVIYASVSKPFISEGSDVWASRKLDAVLDTKTDCPSWESSLCTIKRCNVV
jgi:hypothetical protein